MAGSNRTSSISGARTPEAIGEFWDTHSLDDSPVVREVEFAINARRGHRITLDPDLYEQVESAARVRGVSPETLTNRWLTERLLTHDRPPKAGRSRAPRREGRTRRSRRRPRTGRA